MSFNSDRALRPALLRFGILTGLLLAASGCDRIKQRLYPDATDPVWQSDSTVLAGKPEILFRASERKGSVRMMPMATIGASGFRILSFGNRGWRALDTQYMSRGLSLQGVQDGRTIGPVAMSRGMWDPAGVLDSVPGCNILVPVGIPEGSGAVRLLTSGKLPPLKPVAPLSAADREAALALIPMLIAPTSGINSAQLAKYTREVHVAYTGATSSPSIVVVLDDPEMVPDSTPALAARPRHLVVILDRGVYGYRKTYTYSALGNNTLPPRLDYLDYVDVDGDRQAEVLLGVRMEKYPFATIVLRYENEVWRELVRFGGEPCRG